MIFVITTQKVVLDCYENFFKNKNFANTGFVNLLIDNSLVTGVTNLTAWHKSYMTLYMTLMLMEVKLITLKIFDVVAHGLISIQIHLEHIVRLKIWNQLFSVFWLFNTWFSAHPYEQRG